MHDEQHEETKKPLSAKPKPADQAPAVRAIGEDDDGYDPYTDLHDQRRAEPLFERDPWD